ncbi:MAG: DUF402 domain-containing protein [Acetatifactor sp.]|nr:DUF402 domain-containing protein [Acetatifactor sp.]
MTRKRLNRDKKWGFQFYPYFQMRMENDIFKGLVSLIRLTDGEYLYWDFFPQAGKVPVAGKGMTWLQLIPDHGNRAITAMFLPDKRVSAWYVDVIEEAAFDPDGVAVFLDKYLDVIFTPQGDVIVDDRDELDAAFGSGELTREQYDAALREGDAIIDELCSDIPATEEWCRNILEAVEKKIEAEQFVIFLDVDGVLDVFDPNVHIQKLIPEALERLHRLVARTNAKLVVISDWRYGSKEYVDYCRKNNKFSAQCDNWPYLEEALKKESISIHDVTPWDEKYGSRTEEIAAYLQSNPQIYNYVILDDCFGDDYSSEPGIQAHLVHIDALKGIQDSDLIKACEIMNRLDLQKL